MARTNAHSGRSPQFMENEPVKIRRSIFDRSFGYKTTLNSGFLIPHFVEEVLPGDTFTVKPTFFVRMNTLTVPFMDNVFLDTFYFFVPARLLWDNFQKFMGEQTNPNDSIDYLIPTLKSPDVNNPAPRYSLTGPNSLWDYFGLPVDGQNGVTSFFNVATGMNINALPFRAYNLIWNEWFRDENLENSLEVLTGDGPDPMANYQLLKRNKRHDYFTSALPWPQKGPAVNVGLSGNAPVKGLDFSNVSIDSTSITDPSKPSYWQLYGRELDNSISPLNTRLAIRMSSAPGSFINGSPICAFDDKTSNEQFLGVGGSNDDGYPNSTLSHLDGDGFQAEGLVLLDGNNNPIGSNAYADLSGVNAITINDLRQAFQIQKFYERAARSGTRYTEILRGFFGVISPDARLQRPEYLGGSSERVNIVPVTQQSSTNQTTPQGNLAAFGLMAGRGRGFYKSFVEHGYVIGLVNIRASLTYQQGVSRMWTRRDRFDFYWPQFAHLGEQPVYEKEIFATGNADNDDSVFGYQERYAEYRSRPSQITGTLRSGVSGSLDVWHLAQYFSNPPKLNAGFILEDPPISRVIAVTNEPQFYMDCYFKFKAARPIPVYGTPGLIDHF